MNDKNKVIFTLLITLVALVSIPLAGCQTKEANSPKPELKLDDAIWQLKSYVNGQTEMVNALPGTEVSIEFKDENASGKASCNNYNVTYELNGKSISFGISMSTMMMCAEPKGVMEQESDYLAALTLVSTYQIEGEQLTLLDADGQDVLVYTAASKEKAGLANPASVYCDEQGGKLEIRTDAEGGQTGYCVFNDGSECEEWAFFNGECEPGNSD